ncbi:MULTISPECIES: hypothetical protein [Alicyclobacillus]|uniref:Uncharacterized protein n=1 Tax=Alicyclobacillus acidoterrestris (strain ATCC 49025 / DSM 3922 / CIP 106132 / NCIMB 13137 / GD3B) TaxID=1356854 RepID=T0BCP3_ALIAG|nr:MULTISPECIES: hypothetical protein [Alicyclobacillus]EPZ41803.1 hypothetical protein N007_16565 [Alicyclobacillus acidoterrestris ATCC 49025]UNO49566.1 hypothetical protein K1I37_03195 [Alicyclobacillus acidoterrestris]
MKTNKKWLAAGLALGFLVTTGCGTQATSPASTDNATSSNTAQNNTTQTTNSTGAGEANNTSAEDNTTTPTTADSGTSNLTYVNYTNSRYGFSLQIPSAFNQEALPQDGDGQSWTSSDTEMTVKAFGQYNVNHDTVKSELASLATGKQATYQDAQSNWGVVSGTDGQNIFYDKVYVGSNIYELQIEYPASAANQYSSVVTHIANSFQPGS